MVSKSTSMIHVHGPLLPDYAKVFNVTCMTVLSSITVDTTPPSVVCTNNVFQTVELGTNPVQVFYTEPTASDISGQANLVSRTNVPGDSFPVGTSTVTYVFADNSGNSADACSFTITVTARKSIFLLTPTNWIDELISYFTKSFAAFA